MTDVAPADTMSYEISRLNKPPAHSQFHQFGSVTDPQFLEGPAFIRADGFGTEVKRFTGIAVAIAAHQQ